jgi:LacI family transcriptional regulator
MMSKGNATIYDVADAAFVSIATVSRVINGGSHVRPETRERVDAAIKQLNFIPSSAARSLSGGKKWSIGLAYPLYENRVAFSPSREEDSNVLFTDTIIRGASTQAALMGYSLFACAVRIGHDEGMLPLQQLSSSVDGVILVDRVVNDVGAMRIAKRMRAVHLSGSGATKFGATVRPDNESGIRALVHHLATEHRIRDFGFVGGIPNSDDACARYEAFRAGVKKDGGRVRDENILVGEFSMMRAEAELERRLTIESPLPEVFVCANDQMAIGIIHVLNERGIKVPQDILVTGFDDIPMARTARPGLTTVRQSSFNLGVAAVDLVVGLLDGDVEKGSMVTLPTELVVRKSCGCDLPAGANDDAALN